MDLLLSVARVAMEPHDEQRVLGLLRQPIAWDALIRLARRHRMLPLLHRHLRRIGAASVPGAVMDALDECVAHNVRKSLLLAGELRTVVRLLAGHGIAALSYKGPVLAQQLYGDVALRDIGDLDILVRPDDVPAALGVLAARGYRAMVDLTQAQKSSILRTGSNYALVDEATGMVIELHWTPEASLSAAEVKELWNRADLVSLAGTSIPTFALDDLLVLLSMHGCRHMWERLEWICGIAEMVRSEAVDWQIVLARANRWGARRALLVASLLAHRLLSAPVPAAVLHRARKDAAVGRLADRATEHLVRGDDRLAHQLGWQFHGFQLRSKERLLDKVGYLGRRAFSPSKEDFTSVVLPDRFFGLYAPVRLLRLARRYIHQSLRGS